MAEFLRPGISLSSPTQSADPGTLSSTCNYHLGNKMQWPPGRCRSSMAFEIFKKKQERAQMLPEHMEPFQPPKFEGLTAAGPDVSLPARCLWRLGACRPSVSPERYWKDQGASERKKEKGGKIGRGRVKKPTGLPIMEKTIVRGPGTRQGTLVCFLRKQTRFTGSTWNLVWCEPETPRAAHGPPTQRSKGRIQQVDWRGYGWKTEQTGVPREWVKASIFL